MTEPTDQELAELRDQFGITSNGRGISGFTQVRDFARAVLAKWGTPEGAGEDVDRADAVNLARNVLGLYNCAITMKGVRVLAEAVLSMDAALATPQPTRAQTGAELAEADRRAGAAERKLANCRENMARFIRVRDQMKEQWGVDRNESFDVVWGEALKLKQQAGAVPLTPDEALDAFCHTPGIHQFVQAFMAGVRFAERHHGIKGGQHGTNT